MKKRLFTLLGIALIGVNLFATNIDTIIANYDKNTTFETSILESSLIVKDSFGTSVQEIKAYSRKNGDTLIEITKGPDKGQKVLRLSTAIFLYYPEANQIIRLQGAALKDSFMGSDFSYEDLSGDDSIINNYTPTLVGEDEKSYVVKLEANSRKQAYQQQLLTIDKKTFVATSATLMSASGRELRKMESSDIRKVGNNYIAFKVEMFDLLKRQGSTTMVINKIEINQQIDTYLFTTDNLSW